ncbi:unnamed protein product [Rotaria magnacalcarata]|uniref:G-protein coupled receptors family 1 profile domain-containing protein n=1 Tax=Rotaria magnacalcarata TaxID=392030 RepID=A0A8S2LPT4_9BILA|nr:unnamed protein product [Rotaria magnacalcarata]
MSSIVNLTNTINIDHRAAPLHALLNNASLSNFIQSISSSSYNTNWSISHIPGPPSSFLTYSLSSSSLLTTTIVATEDRYYPFWLLVIVAIFGSVTSVLTVLGNILVMLAFFLDRQIRQPTNYFILSLSVSDFLIGLLSMPLLTIYIYAKEWPLNAIICDIWLSLDYTVCLTSIYTVLFITIDRFCSVKMPAKYRKWRTRRKINIMIAVTWAVPTLIFFTSTMVYPRVRGISNLQNGVCDVQWNKNHVFNLCLTIGYFWTTLFVMIILYIFIYGVASNLERKSRENARKMSSLVGTARNAMTQIGAGIGGNKSPTKPIIDKRNCSNRKMDSTTADDYDDEDPQNLLAHSVINTQNSSNSSDQRRIGGVDDDNSNSFESHSDFDLANPSEKKSGTSNNSNEKSSRQKNRRGMSVNWSNNQTSTINVSSTRTHTDRRSRPSRAPSNQKHASNVKFFATSMAHSLYRNPIRLSGLSSTLKTKGSNPVLNKNSTQLNSNQQQVSATLTPIPSEPELLTCRVNPPPQPRPESLAIMSEELFHQRLKARQSPLLIGTPMKPSITSSLNVNQQLSAKFPSTSSFLLDKHCIEDVTYSTPNQIISTTKTSTSPISSMKQIQQPIITSIQNVDVERALFDFYQCSQINDIDNCLPNNNENSESEDLEYSLSNYNEICEETSSLLRLNEQHSSAFLDDESGVDDYSLKTKQTQQSRHLTYSQNNNYFMKMMMLNKTRRNLTIDTTSDDRTTTNSFSLNTYSEDFSIDKIYQYDSASSYKQQFNISSPNHPMSQHSWCSSSSTATATTPSSCQEKQMPLLLLRTSSPQNFLTAVEKKRTTSSDSDGITTTTTTLTNSTQYEGRDIDKTKQKATNSISQDVLRASNKLNATTITDVSEIQKNHTKEIVLIMNKAINIDTKYHSLSDTLIRDNDTSGYGSHEDPSSINNRVSSKVTFDSFMTHNSAPSSPKTKDQSIMTQTDVRERLNQTNNTSHEPIQDSSENKNGRMVVISEGTVTTGSTSAKSSFKELVQNQKTPIHRKSKSQNRARKALRTITFILGAFVVCWTPWHMYSAIHSLCESCKNNWIFSNPMFHCFYFLCYLNSPINPFCYALANQQFKKTFTRILKLDLRRL